MKGPGVSLRPVTKENLYPVLALDVRPEQRTYVATNAKSLAEAHFHPEAWTRAIYSGETPVGFLMLWDDHQAKPSEEADPYYLWRFMVAAEHQRRGVGARALGLLVDHVRTRPGARRLLASCQGGDHSPEGFYRSLGFARTGRDENGEIELALPLQLEGQEDRS